MRPKSNKVLGSEDPEHATRPEFWSSENESCSGIIYREIAKATEQPELLSPQSNAMLRIRSKSVLIKSGSENKFKVLQENDREDGSDDNMDDKAGLPKPLGIQRKESSFAKEGNDSQEPSFARGDDGRIYATGKLRPTDTMRLVFFEQLFFLIDTKAKGWISRSDATSFLSFTALNLTLEDAKQKVKEADIEEDDRLVRYEFVEMCIDLLWHVSMEQLKVSVENYKAFQAMHSKRHSERRNNERWLQLARQIDQGARIVIPFIYTCLLILVFHMDMRDDYHARSSIKTFEGWGRWEVKDVGYILVLPSLAMLALLARFAVAARQVARQRQLLSSSSPGTGRWSMNEKIKHMASARWRAATLGGQSLKHTALEPSRSPGQHTSNGSLGALKQQA